MSSTDTLVRPSTTVDPRRSIEHLKIELDSPGILPQVNSADLDTIETCERMWTVPFYEQISEMETANPVHHTADLNLRELGISLACFGMDTACMAIALLAAMPPIPGKLSKSITRPLVGRLFPKCSGRP
jgi:hypothetical protein